MQTRILNCRRSAPHIADLKYRHLALQAALLPAAADLQAMSSPVWDQGNSGSCSGYSTKSHIEHLALQEIRMGLPAGQDPQEYIQGKFSEVSAFGIYNLERKREGTLDQDSGATTLRDACLVATQTGAVSEATWPSIQENLFKDLSPEAYAEAAQHKVTSFYEISGLYEMKHCLSSGFPFLFGLMVYDSFMNSSSGIMPMPASSEQCQGGHAILCVGYNDMTQRFKFKNSWSASWGEAGYGEIPYDMMLNPSLAFDQYTLRRTLVDFP